MVTMRMIKVIADQIIDVFAMGNRFVAASCTVYVTVLMAITFVIWRTLGGIHIRNFE